MEQLAIEGGRPVRDRLLPYGHQLIDDADVAAVSDALRSHWLTTGPLVEQFERGFAEFCNASHAVAVSNGTAALHAAAFAAGVGPGDEVITTPLTFVADANCVRYLGAEVVFADVREDTLLLDPDAVRRALTPRTKAIITVDYGGCPSELDDLLELARQRDLVIIEDASHAIGARYRGRPVGSVAHLTTFSLHPVKQMTTGEGGLVLTQDAELAARARLFRNHGIATDARRREASGTWEYDAVELGYNYRLTDVQCALGLSQLRKVPAWLDRRSQLAARYDAALGGLAAVRRPIVPDDRSSGWHLYVIRLVPTTLRVDRGDVFRALRAENIGVNVHYVPVPWHSIYRRLGYRPGSWPVAERAYEWMITLPLWAGMSDHDADDVVTAVGKVCAAYAG